MSRDQVVITEDSHDCGFRRRPMARWAEDGSVAKPRGGKGILFLRCLTTKQIEMDLAQLLAADMPDGNKRTRHRDQLHQVKRSRPDGQPTYTNGGNEKLH
mmetsp:Transcript_5561/g.7518  ORF Transcript_5561/g.7518 Transcript_5561/m.7518 type:complete len:100 (+) Transcript_5561:182-481(+)